MSEKMSPSPEARAYEKWLEESTVGGKNMPPVEKRKAMKEALRSVRDMDKQPESAKPVESTEPKAGKERLTEFVERGELSLAIVERIAAYLDCEPWQALAQLEKSPQQLSYLIRTFEASRAETISANDQKMKLAHGLQEIIELSKAVDQFCNGLGVSVTEFSETERIAYPDSMNRIISHGRVKNIEFLTKEKTTSEPWTYEAYPSRESRPPTVENLIPGYWTVGRILATELPEAFGYKDGKEADRLITAQVEKISRAFNLELYKQGEVFFLGEKTPLQEQLRAINVRQAKELVGEYRKANEAAVRKVTEAAESKKKAERDQERRNKQALRDKLLRLRDINQQLSKQLPVLKSQEGMFAGFLRFLSKERAKKHEQEGQFTRNLQEEQINIIQALFNNIHPGRTLSVLSFERELEYWSQKAEEEAERMVDEDIARGKLEELKSK